MKQLTIFQTDPKRGFTTTVFHSQTQRLN